MALISCPECGKQVSTAAAACPGCGFPVAEKVASGQLTPSTAGASTSDLLMEVRPSWWGYVWHLVFFFLIIPPILAWWQRGAVVLRIYRGRVVLERGRLSKCFREFMVHDIRTVDIDQTFFERLLGIGNLTIATAAATDNAEDIDNIPNPHAVRELILKERQR
jgi:uncharacterized membrane protein YdbT with pleckstrin-like domain